MNQLRSSHRLHKEAKPEFENYAEWLAAVILLRTGKANQAGNQLLKMGIKQEIGGEGSNSNHASSLEKELNQQSHRVVECAICGDPDDVTIVDGIKIEGLKLQELPENHSLCASCRHVTTKLQDLHSRSSSLQTELDKMITRVQEKSQLRETGAKQSDSADETSWDKCIPEQRKDESRISNTFIIEEEDIKPELTDLNKPLPILPTQGGQQEDLLELNAFSKKKHRTQNTQEARTRSVRRTKRKYPANFRTPCYFCMRKFNNSCALTDHYQTHIQEKPYQCLTCKKSFCRKGGLVRHKNLCGLNDDEKADKRKAIQARSISSRDPNVPRKRQECYFCKMKFRNPYDLFIHLKVHTKEKLYSYRCEHCPAAFSRARTLKHHNLLKHFSDLDELGAERIKVLEQKKRRNENQYKVLKTCKKCGASFRSRHAGWKHKLTDCETNMRKWEAELQKRSKNAKRLRQTTKETDVLCNICGKVFKSSAYLYTHVSRCGKGEKKCKFCGKGFDSNIEKRRHQKDAHRSCYFCGKWYNRIRQLLDHIGSHTEERNFKCLECGERFLTNSRRKWHSIMVCGKDEEKKKIIRQKRCQASLKRKAEIPYKCDKCGQIFAQHHGYSYHIVMVCGSDKKKQEKLRSIIRDKRRKRKLKLGE